MSLAKRSAVMACGLALTLGLAACGSNKEGAAVGTNGQSANRASDVGTSPDASTYRGSTTGRVPDTPEANAAAAGRSTPSAADKQRATLGGDQARGTVGDSSPSSPAGGSSPASPAAGPDRPPQR
jgi:hypothetical protein